MFDIIVIGGGHAGVEAAYMAAQFNNLKVGLVSLPGIGLASAPCNPAIGGVGKGQVVRELDAMGALMPQLADQAGIQFRTLNESKGYAVQSTRIQIDKDIYSQKAHEILKKVENIQLIFEKVESLKKNFEEDYFSISTDCSTWNSKKIIITVGTFLNGKMHTGSSQSLGGRVECESVKGLRSFFTDVKTLPVRFKTGTPARLESESIDFSKLEIQKSDPSVFSFHSANNVSDRFITQKDCYLTYTNERTMKVIRDNKEKSPMFNGQINAVGARYCPSIEDKAYRYLDKNIHHVFIEPEGLTRTTMYPSGISTSLPSEVQLEFMKTIDGLEDVQVETYGYAVEYDVVNTTELSYSLEHKLIEGSYFAGQVNGTSGYEEAAAQGCVAGLNAALKICRKEEIIFSRKNSYIGVMIEDLITNERDEPYRLFTARSENRLYIREDNAVLRMRPYRKKIGLNNQVDAFNAYFSSSYKKYKSLLDRIYVSQKDVEFLNLDLNVPRRTSISEIVKRADIDPFLFLKLFLERLGLAVNERVVLCLAVSIKYEGYIKKAEDSEKKLVKNENIFIDLERIDKSENISFECKQRIQKIKPKTFGQLRLIQGVRPATLAVVSSDSY